MTEAFTRNISSKHQSFACILIFFTKSSLCTKVKRLCYLFVFQLRFHVSLLPCLGEDFFLIKIASLSDLKTVEVLVLFSSKLRKR